MGNEFKRKYLEAEAGKTIFASTGMIGNGHPDRMSTLHFYKAVNGSRVSLLNTDYYYNIATYSLNFDEEKYIREAAYQKEQCWTTYNNDLSGDSYRQEDYIFSNEVYFRICLKRVDGKEFTKEEAENINNILLFITKDSQYKEKSFFEDEINKTVKTIKEKKTNRSLALCLLSDSHFTVNGTWEDTIYNIKSINQEVGFDGIVHLGDLTDGMLPAKLTREYVQMVINDMKEIQAPLYMVIGNHDTNYFSNNPESFSEDEQYEIYQKHSDEYVNRDSNNLYYFVDFDDFFIRGIFLTSFNHTEKVRYGFSNAQIEWIKETLESTPKGYVVILFSHQAPLAELAYATEEIRNGDKIISILEEYHLQYGKKIMAFIHGHIHADRVYESRAFPIVSICCAKCEYLETNKPDGAVAQARNVNTVTQELWDTMIITPSENKIDFIRFGAGEDRIVYSNKTEQISDNFCLEE